MRGKIKGKVGRLQEGLWAFWPAGNSGHCGPIFRANSWQDAMIIMRAYYFDGDYSKSFLTDILCKRGNVLQIAKYLLEYVG